MWRQGCGRCSRVDEGLAEGKDAALHTEISRLARSVIEAVCTITAKGQTTVPKAIRQAIGVSYGGRITFRVEDGAASIHAAVEPVGRPGPGAVPGSA